MCEVIMTGWNVKSRGILESFGFFDEDCDLQEVFGDTLWGALASCICPHAFGWVDSATVISAAEG